MSLRLLYCDQYVIPLPPGHKFPATKYRALRSALEADGVFDLQPAGLADPATIELAHDPAYIRHFLDGTLDPALIRRIGFGWSAELVQRTLASMGGTLAAANHAMLSGVGGNLAGGTHHAFRSEGSGFCVFNDIAVAILRLRREGRAARAAVIDLDVHQGDGTAAIFAGDPAVFTASVHGRNNFPFRKQKSSLDIDLPDGTADADYLQAVDEVLPAALSIQPEVVFYQSGVDGLAGDRLGRLSLTHEGLRERDRKVMEACRSRAIPLVITLGGGYAEPVSRTVEAHANTFRTAAQVFGKI